MKDSRTRGVDRSIALTKRAEAIIPGVSQLISRRPRRAASGVSPAFAERAKGCRIWDVDGNEYVDWTSGVGPIILGYADDVVDGAVKEQISKGSLYSILHESEIELAEELIKIVPSAEMVRFAKGGGEACTVAVRIARGVTRRDKVLFSGYHGWHDWYLAANLSPSSLDNHLFPGIEPIGVPSALEGTSIPFEYDNLNMLEDLLKANDGEIACIIMEPMRSEIPSEGYLQGVRDLATRHGVALIFDEVSSGFRIALGGVQEYAGVTPDMSVFAKAISNGYPMAAIVGSREFMAPAEQMFISSAYWDDVIGVAAALATLKELQRRDAVAHIARTGEQFTARINEAAAQAGLDAEAYGIAAHPGIRFNLEDSSKNSLVQTLFVQENAKQGVILSAGSFFNLSHDDEALDLTGNAVRESFSVIRQGLESDGLEDLLESPIQQDLFRRMVR